MNNNILNYWYKIEFFTPCWPVQEQCDLNLCKHQLPWLSSQNDESVRYSYDLYFGKNKSLDLISWMLEKIGEAESERVENDNSQTCIFATKIDNDGFYVEKSFRVSNFVWAICKIVDAQDINIELNPDCIKEYEMEINEYLVEQQQENNRAFQMNDFICLFKKVIADLKLPNELSDFSLWLHKVKKSNKNTEQLEAVESSTGLFSSFYVDDIRRVIESPCTKINNYVTAKSEESNKTVRRHIDSDVDEMKKWVVLEKFPLGVWPSKYNPSLMQQIGINISVSGERDIFSINGPPGTGKTTLLKEIVVNNVVERAKLLIDYSNPDDAFRYKEYSCPPDQYNKGFYVMDERLKGFGILVASNNNAAVENISLDLPKVMSKDRTHRFVRENYNTEDIYFTDVATNLIGQQAWGLISAKLGKKNNLENLMQNLLWRQDDISWKNYYNGSIPDWRKTCENFKKALQQVYEERKRISESCSLIEKRNSTVKEYNVALSDCKKLEAKVLQFQSELETEEKELENMNGELECLENSLKLLHDNMSWFLRFFSVLLKNNKTVIEWNSLKLKKQELVILISKKTRLCYPLKIKVEKSKTELQRKKNYINDLKSRLDDIDNKIELEKKKFKENWADDVFWKNITRNIKSQENCPWVYEKYNELREELFYQALQVHKAFILSSERIKKNIFRLNSVWKNILSKEDIQSSYGDLLNTLMLIIPVVSTTFASVSTFLNGIGKAELGLLIIDEAGQATPQSALGALWRTKRAIVVGDPLQVEPIVNTPKELVKRFAEECKVPSVYKSPDLSVQMLADCVNEFGGYREVNAEKIWLGCPLVVHRRCIDPMFSISNEVAYEKRMFFKSNLPEKDSKFLIDESIWYDIPGKENGNKDHTVKEQIRFAEKLFKDAVNMYEGFPDLFIITPFKSVNNKLKTIMKDVLKKSEFIKDDTINDWVKEHCGTIHTFQGKEAKEVILVLGCDSVSGKYAAEWVGQKPNIINVAVSRAKFRLAVIGDYNFWKSIPNVNVLHNHLNVKYVSGKT